MGSNRLRAAMGVLITSGLILSFLGMMVAVALPSVTLFAYCAAISYLADLLLHNTDSTTLVRLRDSRFGLTMRFLIRQFLLLGLCGAIADIKSFVAQMTTIGLLLLFVLQLAYGALLKHVRKQRNELPFTTRGLDLEALGIRRMPHPFLVDKHVRKTLHLDIPLVGGALATITTDNWRFVTYGMIATVFLAYLSLLVLLPDARNALKLPTADEALDELNLQLAEYRPQVALYFTFAAISKDFMYQVNMWLESLESLELRPIIVLRERATLRYLDATSVPVICVPKADNLARIEMNELRVALYPGNAGKNVHMLQRAEVKHVFIGHGDSDKLASSNRVSKVFDEIWVAGRAGRDRYERIKHAVTHNQIVEVGRPQLMPLQRWTGRAANPAPTVIYAPTWEGWTDDACYTSVIPAGEKLIQALLDHELDIRIIYKPHPLTGSRSAEAAAAHRRIIALLEEDNARRFGRKVTDSKAAAKKLARIDQRIADLSERGVRSKYPDLTEEERTARIRRSRNQAGVLYWSAMPEAAHHAVTERIPALYDCFNHSDLLIGDMSSVVSDFIATLKPYAIFNLEGLPDQEFRNEQRTAYASYLLDADCNGLTQAIEAMLKPAEDFMAPYREQLKEYLLGEEYPPSIVRFDAAASNLYRRGLLDFPIEEPDEAHHLA
ncbi:MULTISPECIES: hypothetical protein [unclassified Streptomyces]|uniref:hypothetical protein n=1 Tax=unclassified Streptomyces TaxID=2593676 RepID=UPI000DC76A40|nr:MULTISPECIES: hypothetical protein [unclassified Streptomyces]AWZ03856.1 hypothetical protein DRB89_03530 [Streptomyces sp. ICC4]AWZ11904.1 hypothetical protein DRB96_05770 [Streptomyces sp. ICC1]